MVEIALAISARDCEMASSLESVVVVLSLSESESESVFWESTRPAARRVRSQVSLILEAILAE